MDIVRSILFQAKHNPPAPAMCAPGAALVSSLQPAGAHPSNITAALSSNGARRYGRPVRIIFHAATAFALANVGIAALSVREPAVSVGAALAAPTPPACSWARPAA
jgi:hypothetical protein